LASGSKETREALASTSSVVANTTAGAITSSFVSVAIKRIGTRGALLEVTGRSTVSNITQASDVLHSIPRSRVGTSNLGSQVLLGPASSSLVAIIRAEGTLASNTIVTREALTSTNLAVTDTLVGAFSGGVKIVGIDNGTNPSLVLGAGTEGAIRAGPLRLAIQTKVAITVAVNHAGSVARARVLAKSTLTVTLLVPSNLSPTLSDEGRRTGRSTRGLT
jgi:hypothetical protein